MSAEQSAVKRTYPPAVYSTLDSTVIVANGATNVTTQPTSNCSTIPTTVVPAFGATI